MKKPALLIMVVFFLASLACITTGSSRSSGSKLEQARRCVKIDLYKCDDFTPRATVTNLCDQDIRIAEFLVTGYSSQAGTKIDADEEFIEDLPVGEDQDFEAVFDPDFKGRIKYCEAELTDILFK